MIIDIYRSATDSNKYLSVPKGTKLETLQWLEPVDSDVLSLSPLRTRLEVDAEKPHNALDAKLIIDQIMAQGYAIHGVTRLINLAQ